MSTSDWSGLAARESAAPIDINKDEPTARARDLRTKKSPERMQAVIDNIRDGQPIT